MSGIYTVTVTSGACSASGTVNVTIDPSVTVNPSSNSPVCQGNTLQLNANPSGGSGSNSFTWAGPAGFSSTTQNPTRANATPAMSGIYTVTVTSGACSASGTVNMNISSPTVTPTSNSPVCQGNTLQLNANPSGGGGSNSFTWAGPAGFSSTTQNPTRANATPAMSGIYTVTVTSGACSASGTVNVTINQSVTVNPSSNSPVCQGNTLQLNANPSGGGGSNSFTWAGPAGFSSTTQNPTRANATPAMSGTYTVTVTSGACSASGTVNVTIDPSVTVNPSSNSPVCQGNTLQLNANPSGGNGSNSFIWAGPAGFSSTTQNPTRANATLAMSGTYTVTVTSGACSASGTVNVTIDPSVTVNPSSNSPVCQGNTLQLNANPSGGGGSNSFTWAGPAGFSSTTQNPTRANATPAMSGIYTVTVTSGACSASGTVNVTIDPSVTVNPSSNSPVCQGNTLQLNANPSGGSGSNSFTWAGPAGFSSTTQNPTRANATPAMSGTYTVTVTSGACSASGTVNVTIDPSVTVNPSSNSPVCQGNTLQLNANPSGGNGSNSFIWAGPAGFSSTTQNPTRANATLAMSGTYTVTVTSGACSASGTVNVIINPTPTTSITQSLQSICHNQPTIAINFIPSVSGSTIDWTNNNPTINLPSSGSGNIPSFTANNTTNSPVTATIIAHSTAAGCTGPDTIVNITVLPTPLTPIVTNQTNSGGTIQTSVCGGVENLNFNVTNIDGNLITWYVTTSPSVPGLVELKKDSVANTVISMYNGSINYTATIHAVLTTSLGCTNDTSITIAVAAQSDSIAEAIIVKKQPGNLLVYLDHTADGYQWGFDSIANLQPNNIPGQVYQAFSPNSSFILLDNTLDETNYAYWVRARYGNCFTKVYYNGPFATRIQKNQETEIPDQIITQILPNPNNGSFNITLSGAIYGDIKLKIINTLGQIVYSQNIEKTSPQYIFTFQDLKLNQGLYHAYITATTGERTTTKFLVIYP